MGRKMRWLLLTLIALMYRSAIADGPAVGIVDVMKRSQYSRLDTMVQAETKSARALRVRNSFDALVGPLCIPASVTLRVVQGEVVAETIFGNVVVANENLAALAEDERRFILAHELGHVMLGHWRQMEVLYEKWIPGEVTPERTDPIAADLGREASALAYQQEFDADGYALRALRLLGHAPQAAIAASIALVSNQMTLDRS